MSRLSRAFSNPRGQLGLASLAVQIASFTMLFFAKVQLTDEGFAFLMTQAALAGIIGSIATFRLALNLTPLEGQQVLALQGTALVVPVLLWTGFFLFRLGRSTDITPALYTPPLELMQRTMAQSGLAYVAAASIVVAGLCLLQDYARIQHPELAFVLVAAVAAQC